jgi:hypothetical protein
LIVPDLDVFESLARPWRVEVSEGHLKHLVIFILLGNVSEPKLKDFAVTALDLAIYVHSRLSWIDALWDFRTDEWLVACAVLVWRLNDKLEATVFLP